MKALMIGCSAVVLLIGLVLLLAVVGFASLGNTPGQVLTHNLSEPLNGATAAKVDISTDSGNLMIGRLASGEAVLASGTLQYLENQSLPTWIVNSSNGQATLSLRSGNAGQPWLRFPWDACNGATEWQIHLNPTVASDITAHSGGGNVKLDLAGMVVTRVSADTGGGNLDVVLPDNPANLNVVAKTGAGNVSVQIPSGIAAKVHATSGVGKVIVDSRLSKLDGNTYQTPDYDAAANRIEITANSGAGNVSVNTK